MGLPEATLIRQEHIIRDLQLTTDVKMTKKSLVRYLALSLGLIAPGESRTLMLDIFEAFLSAHFTQTPMDIHQLIEKIADIQDKRPDEINPKAVRYHTLELKKKGIIEKKDGKYRFSTPPMAEDDDLGSALEYVYLQNAKTTFEKIKLAVATLKTMH